MFQSNRRKKWTYIAIMFLIVCCYIGIYHSHRYFGFNWLLWLTIAAGLALFYLSDLWLDDSKRWYKFKSFLFILCIGSPLGIFVILMHESFIEKQLASHGVPVKEIVTKLYMQRNKNSQTPYAIFNYSLNNKVWTQEVINTNSVIQVGDTLKLWCAKNDPEIFKVE